MRERYTLLVDESGEPGLQKVRSKEEDGASPYMTFGAVIFPNSERSNLEAKLADLTTRIGKKDLHCSNLKHVQKLYFAKEIVRERVRFFGTISYKDTLKSYKDDISADDKRYYNKCVQYLLERVGWFLEHRNIDKSDVDIIFEKRNCDYDMMRNFLRKVQANPIHEMSKKLRHVDVTAIEPKTKGEEPLLQIADLVAHALFKCVDKHDDNFGIVEPRYLSEIAPRFFGDPKDNRLLGAGLYCVHSTREVKLDEDVQQMVLNLEAAQ